MLTPQTCSADTLKLWGALPPFVQLQDQNNDYLFLTWLDGIASQLQQIDNLCRDQGPAVPGWSVVLDDSRCPTYALPWLAQFLGVRLNGILTDAQVRSQLLNHPSWDRGTIGAIAAAAGPFLLSGYTVTVLERTPDPYSLTVDVPSAGLNGSSYATLDSAYATYLALDSTYATYGAFTVTTNSKADITAAITAAVPGGIRCTITFT